MAYGHGVVLLMGWVFAASAVAAESDEVEAIRAQLAAAMASSDYAQKQCPHLEIDNQAMAELTQRSGLTAAELRETEDYQEQRDVIASMASGKQAGMICMALPMAHGGYARGIIQVR